MLVVAAVLGTLKLVRCSFQMSCCSIPSTSEHLATLFEMGLLYAEGWTKVAVSEEKKNHDELFGRYRILEEYVVDAIDRVFKQHNILVSEAQEAITNILAQMQSRYNSDDGLGVKNTGKGDDAERLEALLLMTSSHEAAKEGGTC